MQPSSRQQIRAEMVAEAFPHAPAIVVIRGNDDIRPALAVSGQIREPALSKEAAVPLPAIKGQVRAAGLSMPIGLLLLIGGGAAVALGERALGGALIALGVLSLVIGCIILFRVKSTTTAVLRAARERRLSEMDGFHRDEFLQPPRR